MASVLKNKFVSTVAGTVLSVAGAFGMSNAAYAQDNTVMGAPAQQNASMQQQVNVPTRNVRGTSEAFLRVLAADVSKDSVVLIVYGDNRELYDQVKQAAIDVTAEGYTVRGILVADGREDVEIYADAQRVAHFEEGPPTNISSEAFVASLRSDIRYAHDAIVIPRREEAQRVSMAEDQPVASR